MTLCAHALYTFIFRCPSGISCSFIRKYFKTLLWDTTEETCNVEVDMTGLPLNIRIIYQHCRRFIRYNLCRWFVNFLIGGARLKVTWWQVQRAREPAINKILIRDRHHSSVTNNQYGIHQHIPCLQQTHHPINQGKLCPHTAVARNRASLMPENFSSSSINGIAT